MVDVVAKALCDAAGRSIHNDLNKVAPVCSSCDVLPNGRRVCVYWETFRGEAKAAIIAAYRYHKQERRWPSFCR